MKWTKKGIYCIQQGVRVVIYGHGLFYINKMIIFEQFLSFAFQCNKLF